MIITAAQMLKGGFRPPDRARSGPPGKRATTPDECQQCHAEPHHAKGLGRSCYDKTKSPVRTAKRAAARKGAPRRGGRVRQYPLLCMHCKTGTHIAKGLCPSCYNRWNRDKTGPIQPFAPVYGPGNPYRGEGHEGSSGAA